MREDRQLFLQTTTTPINKFSGRLGPTPDSAGLAVLLGSPEPIFGRGSGDSGVTTIPDGPMSQLLPISHSHRSRVVVQSSNTEVRCAQAGALASPQASC